MARCISAHDGAVVCGGRYAALQVVGLAPALNLALAELDDLETAALELFEACVQSKTPSRDPTARGGLEARERRFH